MQKGLPTLIDLGGADWDKVGVTALVWVALPLALGIARLERGDID